jgi:uncharacterized protein YbaR (Trm112 family)
MPVRVDQKCEARPVPIDPELLAICVCPSADHAPLLETDNALICSYCQTSYPIRDGIPVLLLDDATPGPNGIGNAATPST